MKNFFKELFRVNIQKIDEQIKTREIVSILEEISSLLPKSFENFFDTTWGIGSSIMHLFNTTKSVIFFYDDRKELYLPLFSFGLDKNEVNNFFLKNLSSKNFFLTGKQYFLSKSKAKNYPAVNNFFRNFNIKYGVFEPLMLHDKVIAYLFVADKSNGEDFNNHDMKIFNIMIPFYKLILQNAIMHQKEKKRAKDLEHLRKIDRLLIANLEPKKVIDLIIKKLVEIFNVESASVLLTNKKNNCLDIYSAYGESEEFVKKTKIPIGKGVTGLAAKEKKTIRVNNVKRDKRYIADETSKMNSEMAAPLIVGEEIIGVLNIEALEKAKFSSDDEILFNDFALNAAIILNRALKSNKK
jgi:putative methionine-R-sulfoxide reductase with GAF domain